jgi:hypothetical protein
MELLKKDGQRKRREKKRGEGREERGKSRKGRYRERDKTKGLWSVSIGLVDGRRGEEGSCCRNSEPQASAYFGNNMLPHHVSVSKGG